ncbi:rap domain-containing protein [Cystoisospora suis]|uniref:Rap domain-containing protein n=1 Tax=Cystoisospora suis TaxID=483139 RepID=A0A2C6L691_9APIC|nr:rap domain-containing protein [Cystoisospora suis]
MSPVAQGLRHGRQQSSFHQASPRASSLVTGSELSAAFATKFSPVLHKHALHQPLRLTGTNDQLWGLSQSRSVTSGLWDVTTGRESLLCYPHCGSSPLSHVSPRPSFPSFCLNHFSLLSSPLEPYCLPSVPLPTFTSRPRAHACTARPGHLTIANNVNLLPLTRRGTPSVLCFPYLAGPFLSFSGRSFLANSAFFSTKSSRDFGSPLPASSDTLKWTGVGGDSRQVLEAMYLDDDDACHARTRRLERKKRKKKPTITRTTSDSPTESVERPSYLVHAEQRGDSPPLPSEVSRASEEPTGSADSSLVITPFSPFPSVPSSLSSSFSTHSLSSHDVESSSSVAQYTPTCSDFPEGSSSSPSPRSLENSILDRDIPCSSSPSLRSSPEASSAPPSSSSSLSPSCLSFSETTVVQQPPAGSASPRQRERRMDSSLSLSSLCTNVSAGNDVASSPHLSITNTHNKSRLGIHPTSAFSSPSLSLLISETLSTEIQQKYEGIKGSHVVDDNEEDDDDDDPLALFCPRTSSPSSLTPPPLKPTPPKASSRRLTARAYQLHRQGSASSARTDPNAWMSEPWVLVKMLYKAARNNIRDEKLWKTFVQRVCLTAVNMKADQLALVLYSFARVRYFDARVPHTLTPYILKLLDDFSVQGLTLLLNSFKKLRLHKYDTMELIINQLCFHMGKCSSQDLALAANSLSHFYIYHSKFWKLLLKSVPRLKTQIEPRHAVLLVGSFARIDLRDGSTLLLLSHILKKHAGALDQAQLSVAVAAFSKLDFTHPKLTISFHRAIHQLFARDPGAFDNQALCLLIHSTICLTGGSEQLIRKLLYALVKRNPTLAVHQTRKLRHAAVVLQSHHRDIYEGLDESARQFLRQVKNATAKELGDHGSRWAIEVAWILQEMGISFQRRLLVNGCRIDILLPEKKIAIICAGPHHFYLDSTRRTSYSKLQQSLLELQSFSVCILPYYEWSELHTPEEKQRYLWAFGRRAAMELRTSTINQDDEALEEAEVEQHTRRGVSYKNSFEDDPVELMLQAEHVEDHGADECTEGSSV